MNIIVTNTIILNARIVSIRKNTGECDRTYKSYDVAWIEAQVDFCLATGSCRAARCFVDAFQRRQKLYTVAALILPKNLTNYSAHTSCDTHIMATITMTPSRFGNSFSVAQSQYGADAPSMAESLPSIDFGFNDLRERMAQFTARFDEFIERGRKRVLEERNAFRMSVAELEGESSTTF